MTTLLQIGSRPGWPGTRLANYVTHAVYRISPISDLGRTRGYIKGYGKTGNAGVVVLDGSAVSGAQYTWIDPELYIEDQEANTFESNVAGFASGVTYTGIGGNCYTPIVQSLDVLLNGMRARNAEDSEVADVQIVLQRLLGSNYGMGTRITNRVLLTGLALFVAIGAGAAYARYGSGNASA